VPVLDYERVNLSLRTQFDLGAVNLETTTGYMDSNAEQMSDGDSSNILLNELPFTTHVETVSQEVRLLSHSGGRLNWLIGAYAFNLAGDMDLILRNSNGPGTPVREGTLFPRVKTTSFAGFAEGTYELVPSLFVTGGVRYTTEKRKFSQTSNGVLVGQGEVEKSYNKWTYRGAIRYNFAEKANVFVSYGTGFKSGVYNAVGTSLRPTDPETIKAWEGGVKADPLSWLRTNLSIYHYNYEDLQVQARDAAGVSYILQNAANAKIYGGEFELTVSPVEDLNLRGSVAYAHGEYQDFPLAQTFVPQASGGNAVVAQDVSGKRTIRTPRATFNLGVDWAHPLAEGRLMVTANVFHSSRVYYDFLNVYSQNPYWMASGEISWSTPDERWKFSLWGKNITDAVVLQQLKPGALSTDALYEAPRRIGVGAEYRF
jgi:iron complex outermembrane receptor protein